jgi:two-component system, OmpR family, alkaline phosphatase synthesis response regulator PhoP
VTTPAKVLIIEDHEGIAMSLRTNLEVEGHLVETAGDGDTGLLRCESWNPDLVILDLMLPGIDGFEVLRTMRARRIDVPVLILSAIGAEVEKVRGFRLGADDYVTKPFGLMELLARVEALLRRRTRDALTTHAFGDVTIEVESRRVTRRGELIALRPREFDLLVALARQAGRVMSKEQLLREVWGYGPGVMSRTVDTHVLELRRRLEDDPANPRHLRTMRGAGYVLDL